MDRAPRVKGFSVSNLAWGGAVDHARCEWLAVLGVQGTELAPTALSGGTWPTASEVRAFSAALTGSGLRVSGLQSLLFGLPELALFDLSTWPEMTRRLTACAELGADLGADVLVFGSPRNRLRGTLPLPDAIEMAAQYFTTVVPIMADHGVILSLEPNPRGYGADFMTTYTELLSVVDAVGSPWVRPQIDTGCLTMAGDDAASAVRRRTPVHAHISAPGLGALPGAGVDHVAVAAALHQCEFQGWVTLEILGANLQHLDELDHSIRWMMATYA
jgi:D-psicose/D-tagatose/L-ribulose 3-epimerase